MKTTYYIKNDKIVDRKCTLSLDFDKDDDVYYDTADKNIHVTLLDLSYLWQVVKVHMNGNKTVFVWLDDGDDLFDVFPAEEMNTFIMTELDRIELSYKKNISVIVEGIITYEDTDLSTRLRTVDQARYDALIAAA